MEKRNQLILNKLREVIPKPATELHYSNNFELLVAVILSAQCTDKRVNMVVPELFEKYGTPEKMAVADPKDVERIIKPCGFYNNKTANIINASKQLVEKFNGQVPATMEELTSLSGVGRKTANVVMMVGFGIPSVPVDTHVFRVSNRLEIAKGKNVRQVEEAIMKNFNKEDWNDLHHLLILFGRYKCKAINPQCETCELRELCKYKKEKKNVSR